MESALMERSVVLADAHAEHVAKVYDKMAVEYDDIREPYFYNTYEMFDRFLAPRLEAAAGARGFDRALDIGCGSGLQLFRLQRLAHEVVGIDISEGLLDVAREKFKRYPHIHLEMADATALPYEDASFDCVNCYGEVFSHIQDCATALRESSRVLKKGGVLVFDIDNKWHPGLLYSPGELWQSLTQRGNVERDWEYVYEDRESVTVKTGAYTHRGLVSMLVDAGFEVRDYTGCHILSSLVPYRYQAPFEASRLFSVGKLGLIPELCISLGKLDQAWGRHWPLNRLGFTKVIFAQKV
jgi:ubiquinone/menaquinone biosynthesis C-methylase UbiE